MAMHQSPHPEGFKALDAAQLLPAAEVTDQHDARRIMALR